MIQYFDSELEKGWKNGYCLICKSEKCRHLIRCRNEKMRERGWNPFTKEELKISLSCVPDKKGHKQRMFEKIKKVGRIPSTPEEKEMDRERANSKIGFGVKTMSGFVGGRRKW